MKNLLLMISVIVIPTFISASETLISSTSTTTTSSKHLIIKPTPVRSSPRIFNSLTNSSAHVSDKDASLFLLKITSLVKDTIKAISKPDGEKAPDAFMLFDMD